MVMSLKNLTEELLELIFRFLVEFKADLLAVVVPSIILAGVGTFTGVLSISMDIPEVLEILEILLVIGALF
jgi:hypothetical protein